MVKNKPIESKALKERMDILTRKKLDNDNNLFNFPIELKDYRNELKQLKDKSNMRISILNAMYYHSLHKRSISYKFLCTLITDKPHTPNFKYHLKKLVEFNFILRSKQKSEKTKRISTFYSFSEKGSRILDLLQIGIRKLDAYTFNNHPSLFIDIALLEISLMLESKSVKYKVFKKTQLRINELIDKKVRKASELHKNEKNIRE